MATSSLRVVRERSCGACSACCTTMEVAALSKANHERCPHLVDTGCGRYSSRPMECRTFKCSWLAGLGGDEHRPDLAGLVMYEGDAVIDGRKTRAVIARETEPGRLVRGEGFLLDVADGRYGRRMPVFGVTTSGAQFRFAASAA